MEASWKRAIAHAASLRRSGRGSGVSIRLLEVTGKPVSIRVARGNLFSNVRKALAGKPMAMAIEEDAVVVLIALSDFASILEEPPETLADGLAESGFKPAGRGRRREV